MTEQIWLKQGWKVWAYFLSFITFLSFFFFFERVFPRLLLIIINSK